MKSVIEVAGEPVVLHVSDRAAIPRRRVDGPPVTSLQRSGCAIRGALVMLLSGF